MDRVNFFQSNDLYCNEALLSIFWFSCQTALGRYRSTSHGICNHGNATIPSNLDVRTKGVVMLGGKLYQRANCTPGYALMYTGRKKEKPG